ncbi:hypothetical protein HH303_07195 [Rhodospirillaceae bacterium KN72]|uniref:Uncharacterized protein n=1 Tax=Pacificispira spongiicola TaxID=2729598 RepID=A0A7Y0HFU5_9PROT|nr:hypothetical protein [Pacificispira spongiicola]NMM44257.1 hypothetical protein [Pacificispira spongiicola]
MEKKTHREAPSPEIPLQYLADYMGASNQARRSIVQKCKYKALARTFQHQIARKTITDHLLDGNPLPGDLADKAEEIRNRIADTPFDATLHGYNADFVDAFAAVSSTIDFSSFELVAPPEIENPMYNGTIVRFTPSLLSYRTTKANTQKIGGIMFRYSKGTPLNEDVGGFQAAFMYGFFTDSPFIEEAKPERGLCRVICALSGKVHTAPVKPIYKFNEMKAVCYDIAEKWENIAPPSGAIL